MAPKLHLSLSPHQRVGHCGFLLTGLHRPAWATVLNATRVLGFLISLSYLGAHVAGVRGVFAGRLATDLIVGTIGLVWVSRTLASVGAAAAARKSYVAESGTPQ